MTPNYLTHLNSNNADEFRMAVGAIFQHFQKDLEDYLKQIGAGTQAKDILQEVFIKFLNTHNKETKFIMKHKEASLKAYLKTMLFRQFLQWKKKRNKHKEIANNYLKQKPSFAQIHPFKEENYFHLEGIIASTLNAQDQYFFFRSIEKKGYTALLSEEFNVPLVNIRVRLHRVRLRLKKNINIKERYNELNQ